MRRMCTSTQVSSVEGGDGRVNRRRGWTGPGRSPRMKATQLMLGIALLCVCSEAYGGQVRVTFDGEGFHPRNVTANVGDFVVWVGAQPSYYGLSSGDTLTFAGDGHFQSNASSLARDSSFAWIADEPGAFAYFAYPWTGSSYIGVVNVVESGAPVSNFRVTKLQFGSGPGTTRIQVSNLGGADGDCGLYRLRLAPVSREWVIGSEGIGSSIPVPSGGSVVLHLNSYEPDTPTDLWLYDVTVDLADTGAVQLRVPSSYDGGIPGVELIADFVQWGAAGQRGEADAALKGVWVAGTYASGTIAPDHFLEFCGAPDQHGAQYWSEVDSPDFSTVGGCATPTRDITWGRLKSLYR